MHNKVVWITGASSGIGEELVHLFSRMGAKIVLSARRYNELVRVKNESLLGEAESLLLDFDLNDTSQVAELAKKVIDKFGQIDILINNGGISQRSLAADTPINVDRKIMEVNFFAGVALTKAVLPYMTERKSGQIIVISSLMGKIGFFNRSGYAASKHALHGFYDSLRLELLESNIRVLIACPGYVKTNISLNALNSTGEAHAKMDKNQHRGMPADKCANIIYKAMLKNKKEIMMGGKEVLAAMIRRFIPGLYFIIAKNQKH